MRDKRYIDELSLEELERVLVLRRREARQAQLHRLKKEGRVVGVAPASTRGGLDLPPELADAVEPVENHLKVTPPAPDIPHKVTPPTIRKATPIAPSFDEDEANDVDMLPRRRPATSSNRHGGRTLVNGLLFFVEIAAVIGLIVLGVNLLSAREDLVETTRREQQIAQATRAADLPTLAPTAVLRMNVNDWVLPGGHTFIEGQPVQNITELAESDIPRHLLPEVQMKLIAPVIDRPQRRPETALGLNIPGLNLDETIIQGSDWEALKLGVGQVLNGTSPGDITGNVVLAAHNDIYGELFRHLDQMAPGDQFTIRTEERAYTYVVTDIQIVQPTDVWVMENTGVPTATLISCYPYRINDQRIVVFAERLD